MSDDTLLAAVLVLPVRILDRQIVAALPDAGLRYRGRRFRDAGRAGLLLHHGRGRLLLQLLLLLVLLLLLLLLRCAHQVLHYGRLGGHRAGYSAATLHLLHLSLMLQLGI